MRAETRLFFQRWLANPGQVASLYPSSDRLSDLIAKKVLREAAEYVLEGGAGTGSIGRALLRAGLPQERLVMIELDRIMSEALRKEFSQSLVLTGDALRPSSLVPPELSGRFTACVSGLPILHYRVQRQRAFVEE